MAVVRLKDERGYYVCRRIGRPISKKHPRRKQKYSDIFLVKAQTSSKNLNWFSGKVEIPLIYFPKEFCGKRVRFKVELVDEIKHEVPKWLKGE